MVKILGKILLLAMLPALCRAEASGGQWYGVYLPIALPSMVRGANRIFVGKVESVAHGNAPGVEQFIEVRVEYVLKGFDLLGNVIVIRQGDSLLSSVQAGERVLWFLSRETPRGYSVPFGLTSGDFRVASDDTVSSENGNLNLWADDGQLWDSGECDRDRFMSLLNKAGLTGRSTLKYLRWADSAYVVQDYPLMFFLTTSLSCLSDADYARFKNFQQPPPPVRAYRISYQYVRQRD